MVSWAGFIRRRVSFFAPAREVSSTSPSHSYWFGFSLAVGVTGEIRTAI